MSSFDKFEALSEDKQKTILNAAMTEFVKGGYSKASVNNIVEAAGISKGSLFYYFSSKKKLYLYMFEYCEELIIANARKYLSEGNSDFITRMGETMDGNMNLLKEYPLVYGFVRSCKAEQNPSVYEDIQKIKERTNDEILGAVYRDVDTSLFKDEVDIQKSMFTIKSTLFQVVHDFMRKGSDNGETLKREVDEYLDFFRGIFYK